MLVTQIPTPALILDRPTLMQNLAAMDALLKDSPLGLRPHYKSHKCADLAGLQLASGAVGMTCAKLSEAEDLADSGVEDILIANQIAAPDKVRRVADLAARCRLSLCVDDEANIDALDRAAAAAGSVIHCLVELDIGMDRCGVTEDARVLALAQYIRGKGSLTFDGIQAYAGHVSHMESESERRAYTDANAARLKGLLALLDAHGVPARTVSGGSTGTAAIKAGEGLYTELQAGSYLMMDATYAGLGLPFQNALFLLTTVVSARDGLTVVDAGVKTCGVDQGMPVPVGFDVDHIVASEEHFQLHGPTASHRPGDVLRMIPAHCCSTVNLHDRIYLVEGEKVVGRLLVTGRGYGR